LWVLADPEEASGSVLDEIVCEAAGQMLDTRFRCR
jgi:hypothetical protein